MCNVRVNYQNFREEEHKTASEERVDPSRTSTIKEPPKRRKPENAKNVFSCA